MHLTIKDIEAEAISKGTTLRQLCKDCGYSYITYWSWATGRRKPNLCSVIKLNGGLKC